VNLRKDLELLGNSYRKIDELEQELGNPLSPPKEIEDAEIESALTGSVLSPTKSEDNFSEFEETKKIDKQQPEIDVKALNDFKLDLERLSFDVKVPESFEEMEMKIPEIPTQDEIKEVMASVNKRLERLQNIESLAPTMRDIPVSKQKPSKRSSDLNDLFTYVDDILQKPTPTIVPDDKLTQKEQNLFPAVSQYEAPKPDFKQNDILQTTTKTHEPEWTKTSPNTFTALSDDFLSELEDIKIEDVSRWSFKPVDTMDNVKDWDEIVGSSEPLSPAPLKSMEMLKELDVELKQGLVGAEDLYNSILNL